MSLEDSLLRIELALLRQRHAEEKTAKEKAEATVSKLRTELAALKRKLRLQGGRSYEHDAHSEGRSSYYIPDPVKHPKT